MDLVIQRVESSSGIGLGRPVQRMLQGTDRVEPTLDTWGGTSTYGTHRPLLVNLRVDEAAALPSPAVVLSTRLDRYYGRLRRRPGRSPTSRLDTGYRTPRSGASPQSPGRGRPPLFPPSPSQRSAPSTPRSSSRLNSRLCTASMAFTLKDGARLSFDPAPRGHFHDAAGFA